MKSQNPLILQSEIHALKQTLHERDALVHDLKTGNMRYENALKDIIEYTDGDSMGIINDTAQMALTPDQKI